MNQPILNQPYPNQLSKWRAECIRVSQITLQLSEETFIWPQLESEDHLMEGQHSIILRLCPSCPLGVS